MDDQHLPDEQDPIDLPLPTRKYVERRKKQDWVVRSVTIIAIIGWISALFAFLLIQRASPLHENFITRILNVDVASYWNSAMLRGAFIAILVSFLISLIGFLFNMTRHRRKTDKYNKLLITIGVLSVIVLVVFLVLFARYLT
ncbi:MAG: hypothetical protein FWH33_06700 [Oscillospiraceae bacterium]|nr:hypothetical protein [Oscillospiraceae bacterium]